MRAALSLINRERADGGLMGPGDKCRDDTWKFQRSLRRAGTTNARGDALASQPEHGALVGIKLVDEADLPGEVGAGGIEVAFVAAKRVEDEIDALGIGW